MGLTNLKSWTFWDSAQPISKSKSIALVCFRSLAVWTLLWTNFADLTPKSESRWKGWVVMRASLTWWMNSRTGKSAKKNEWELRIAVILWPALTFCSFAVYFNLAFVFLENLASLAIHFLLICCFWQSGFGQSTIWQIQFIHKVLFTISNLKKLTCNQEKMFQNFKRDSKWVGMVKVRYKISAKNCICFMIANSQKKIY